MRRPPRLRLFEFNDLPATPSFLREAETDALRGLQSLAGVPGAVRALLVPLIARLKPDQLVDLCSGGTGPLLPAMVNSDVPIVCTDLFPSRRAARLVGRSRPSARYEPASVDATAVPAHLTGLRTVINALHHFPDDAAHAVLADATNARQPIVIIELLARSWRDLALICGIPIGVFATLPFVRPSTSALVATYALPIVPFMVGFDGVVSCLRARTQSELMALTTGLDGHQWTSGTHKTRLVTLTWLLGEPRLT